MHPLTRYGESILSWVGALSLYDPSTALHSARVAALARDLAREIGLPEADVELAGCAALLHDLGKLAVPLAVLNKPGRLNAEEWSKIRNHPGDGADIIASLDPSLEPMARAVRSHHERWDGGGYPDGLAGSDIPLIGRIVAIADVYDAITHARTYRERIFTTQQAMSEVAGGAGLLFDPRLVSAFISMVSRQQHAVLESPSLALVGSAAR